MLHATNIATPIAMLTRHADKALASQAAHLAGRWRKLALDVRLQASNAVNPPSPPPLHAVM